jgi:hypothetical protein
MANQNPLKYARPFHMRVDDEFYEAVKDLRLQGQQGAEMPSQADVVRKAVFDARDRGKAQKARELRR